jgi:hypothetical protein
MERVVRDGKSGTTFRFLASASELRALEGVVGGDQCLLPRFRTKRLQGLEYRLYVAPLNSLGWSIVPKIGIRITHP